MKYIEKKNLRRSNEALKNEFFYYARLSTPPFIVQGDSDRKKRGKRIPSFFFAVQELILMKSTRKWAQTNNLMYDLAPI